MDSFPGESSGWVINSAVIPKLWMFGRKVPNLFRGLREDFLEAVTPEETPKRQVRVEERAFQAATKV